MDEFDEHREGQENLEKERERGTLNENDQTNPFILCFFPSFSLIARWQYQGRPFDLRGSHVQESSW